MADTPKYKKVNVDPDEYKQFAKKNKATFYQSINHLKFLEKVLETKINYITFKDNNKLKGVMPFFIKESIYGKVVNSLPFLKAVKSSAMY